MSISDAMRKGAEKRPQTWGTYFDYSDLPDGTTVMCSCAMGAMLEGIAGDEGVAAFFENTLSMDDYLSALGIPSWSVLVKCPGTSGQTQLIDSIIQLNDEDGWTREAIAAWLESIGY